MKDALGYNIENTRIEYHRITFPNTSKINQFQAINVKETRSCNMTIPFTHHTLFTKFFSIQ